LSNKSKPKESIRFTKKLEGPLLKVPVF